jgi:hypothetical protein
MRQFGYSNHALREMAKRDISRSVVDAVLAGPMQSVPIGGMHESHV